MKMKMKKITSKLKKAHTPVIAGASAIGGTAATTAIITAPAAGISVAGATALGSAAGAALGTAGGWVAGIGAGFASGGTAVAASPALAALGAKGGALLGGSIGGGIAALTGAATTPVWVPIVGAASAAGATYVAGKAAYNWVSNKKKDSNEDEDV
jgi:hypothetical protein